MTNAWFLENRTDLSLAENPFDVEGPVWFVYRVRLSLCIVHRALHLATTQRTHIFPFCQPGRRGSKTQSQTHTHTHTLFYDPWSNIYTIWFVIVFSLLAETTENPIPVCELHHDYLSRLLVRIYIYIYMAFDFKLNFIVSSIADSGILFGNCKVFYFIYQFNSHWTGKTTDWMVYCKLYRENMLSEKYIILEHSQLLKIFYK